jgi:hypothetical protein
VGVSKGFGVRRIRIFGLSTPARPNRSSKDRPLPGPLEGYGEVLPISPDPTYYVPAERLGLAEFAEADSLLQFLSHGQMLLQMRQRGCGPAL